MLTTFNLELYPHGPGHYVNQALDDYDE